MTERTVVVLPMPLRRARSHSPARTPNETPNSTWLRRRRRERSTSSITPRPPRRGRRAAPRGWRGPPRRAGGDDAPVDQTEIRSRGKTPRHVVLDQDEGLAPLREESSRSCAAFPRAHSRNRFVEQQQARRVASAVAISSARCSPCARFAASTSERPLKPIPRDRERGELKAASSRAAARTGSSSLSAPAPRASRSRAREIG